MCIDPIRFFFPVMTWPGAIVLSATSLILRLLIFFALMLSESGFKEKFTTKLLNKVPRSVIPAVTAFVKTILLLIVLLPLRGTLCWNMEVMLTPSIIPLATFNCSFTTKELNFVPGGSWDSLVFTKVFTGTPSIYPVLEKSITNK